MTGDSWSTRRKTSPSDTLSTTNLARTALGSNPDLRSKRVGD